MDWKWLESKIIIATIKWLGKWFKKINKTCLHSPAISCRAVQWSGLLMSIPSGIACAANERLQSLQYKLRQSINGTTVCFKIVRFSPILKRFNWLLQSKLSRASSLWAYWANLTNCSMMNCFWLSSSNLELLKSIFADECQFIETDPLRRHQTASPFPTSHNNETN